MTLRVAELFLVSLIVSLVASVATVLVGDWIEHRWLVAVPWGVLAGGIVGAGIAVVQSVTGSSFLHAEEEL